jgi:hypothetical protein
MNPLMFSIKPSTRSPVFFVKSYSFDTSKRDTACGVVTRTDERVGRSLGSDGLVAWDWWARSGESCSKSEMCSSDVPNQIRIQGSQSSSLS